MEASKKICLLTDSPDSYLDIFNVFYTLFKRNWPDCPYEFYLTVEESNVSYDGINIVKCGVGKNQIERLLFAIKNISADFVVLFDEDIFFSKKIHNKDIQIIPDIMSENGFVYWRLAPFPKQRIIPVKNHSYLSYVDAKKRYGKSLMFQVFEKKYLIELFDKEKQTGWDIENNWVIESLKTKEKYFSNFVIDTRDLFGMIHGISKGKWIRSSLRKLKKNHLVVNLKIRPKLPLLLSIVANIKNIVVSIVPNRFVGKMKLFLKKIGFKFAIKN